MNQVWQNTTLGREMLSGQPVFKDSRVPEVSLSDHLEKGMSLDEFSEDFPSEDCAMAIAVLEIAQSMISNEKLLSLIEAAA